MGKKSYIKLFFLFACSGTVLLCSHSPFDPSTSLGQQVIEDIYPNSIDLQHAFKVVSVALPVVHDTSIRFDTIDHSDSIQSGLHEKSVTVGNINGERSIGYMEFRTAALRTSANIGNIRIARDSGTIDSVYLKISYPSDTMKPKTITIDSCPIKPHGTLFDSTKLGPIRLWTHEVQYDTFSDTTALIPLDTSMYLPKIRKAIDTAAASVDTDSVAFCIRMEDTSKVLRLSSASIVIRYRVTPDTTKRTETIKVSYVDYSVFESGAPSAGQTEPSSWEADRFVEVKIDLSALWDSVTNAAGGKNYAVVQAASCSVSAGPSTIDPGADSELVLYGLLDHTLDNKAAAQTMRDSLNYYTSVGRLKRNMAVRSAKTFDFSCTFFLQSLLEERKTVGYLYLFSNSNPLWTRMFWQVGSSIRFNVLMSNPQK